MSYKEKQAEKRDKEINVAPTFSRFKIYFSFMIIIIPIKGNYNTFYCNFMAQSQAFSLPL